MLDNGSVRSAYFIVRYMKNNEYYQALDTLYSLVQVLLLLLVRRPITQTPLPATLLHSRGASYCSLGEPCIHLRSSRLSITRMHIAPPELVAMLRRKKEGERERKKKKERKKKRSSVEGSYRVVRGSQ